MDVQSIKAGLQPMKIGVVGGGWNGCHLALEMKKEGHEVEIFEKLSDIFEGVSGKFGIRLHKGPHYPRSKSTRDSCHVSFDKFHDLYPELVIHHEQAIYAHGELDALGHPAKVSAESFGEVCNESPECHSLNLEASDFEQLQAAYDLDEPSIAIGHRLRNFFRAKLNDASIKLHLNSNIEKTTRDNGVTTMIDSHGDSRVFDVVINATAYRSLVPDDMAKDLPVDIDVTYQTCIALCYEDTTPQDKPLSFIVMDGWFPCVMPVIDSDDHLYRNYILTHGSYTILGSFDEAEEAESLFRNLDDASVESTIKPHVEAEITRFWPQYTNRFIYKGWKGSVLPKLKTRSEFRSSLTFEKDGVIHVFPGKVSNVFNAKDEAMRLINDEAWRKQSGVREENGIRFTDAGALSTAQQEIGEKPGASDQHTSNLQSYATMTAAAR
ncbi:hypothetical protein MMC30_006781 [Trapelia coarctata]|nr:hypothetical protein [Trapelia coarctata]